MLPKMKFSSPLQFTKSIRSCHSNLVFSKNIFHTPNNLKPFSENRMRIHSPRFHSLRVLPENNSYLHRSFTPRYSQSKNSQASFWRNFLVFLPLALGSNNEVLGETKDEIDDSDWTVIFTTPGCPYCRQAKGLLNSKQIKFHEVDMSMNAELRRAVSEETKRLTVPVVFIKGRYIGGFDELNEASQNGSLQNWTSQSSQPLPEAIISAIKVKAADSDSLTHEKSISDSLTDRQSIRRLRLEQIADMMHDSNDDDDNNNNHSNSIKRIEKMKVHKGWKSQKNVFSGSTAVKWFLDKLPDIESKEEALSLGREMQKEKLIHHVEFSEEFSNNSESYFRLHADEPSSFPSSALNAKTTWLKPSRPASQVADDLRRRMIALYEEALSSDGKSVNYLSLSKSKAFESYVHASQELQQVSLHSLSRDEAMAFWINVYNALVIHAIVASMEKGKSTLSPIDRFFFYSQNAYVISNHAFSLDDIEHGILRSNHPKPTNLLRKPTFGPTDPRRFYSLVPRDPRIHFALNCGAKSCPPIKVFDSQNLEYALQSSTVAFCESEVEVEEGERRVVLSKLWDWYGSDFGKDEAEVLNWIVPFLDEPKSMRLRAVMQRGGFKVVFKKYDWDLNE